MVRERRCTRDGRESQIYCQRVLRKPVTFGFTLARFAAVRTQDGGAHDDQDKARVHRLIYTFHISRLQHYWGSEESLLPPFNSIFFTGSLGEGCFSTAPVSSRNARRVEGLVIVNTRINVCH